MAFEKLTYTPIDPALAMRNSSIHPSMYEGDFREQLALWKAIETKAKGVDFGRYAVASELVTVLDEAIRNNIEPMHVDFETGRWRIPAHGIKPEIGLLISPYALEALRRRAFGSLGMAKMMHGLTATDGEVGQIFDDATMLLDDHSSISGLPDGFTIHTSAEASEAILPPITSNDAWYQDGDLLVHRSTVCRPSPHILRMLVEYEAPPSFLENLVSIEGHMAAFRAELY